MMKKKYNIYFTLAILLFGCINMNSNYIFSTNHLQIKTKELKGWEDRSTEDVFLILSPEDENSKNFRTNINIVSRDVDTSTSIMSTTTKAINFIKKEYGDSSIVNKNIERQSLRNNFCTYKFIYNNKKFKIKQVWFIEKGMLFTCTFTSLDETFHLEISTFDVVIEKIKVL